MGRGFALLLSPGHGYLSRTLQSPLQFLLRHACPGLYGVWLTGLHHGLLPGLAAGG
jgi:hypothetical protein